jgi:hypothetical protein
MNFFLRVSLFSDKYWSITWEIGQFPPCAAIFNVSEEVAIYIFRVVKVLGLQICTVSYFALI